MLSRPLPTNPQGIVTAATIRTGSLPDRLPFSMTTIQVAEVAHVHPHTVHGWVKNNRLTPAVPGGRGRGCGHIFDGETVLAFLRKRAQGVAR